MRSILKGQINQIRGYSLSCPTFLAEEVCGDDDCRTCKYAFLVRNFPEVVQRKEYVLGFERKLYQCLSQIWYLKVCNLFFSLLLVYDRVSRYVVQ